MKNFVVFANCQSSAFAYRLLENKGFSSKYQWHKIPAIQNIEKSDIADVLEDVRQADLFIYQPVAESPHRSKELTSEFMKRQLKDDATVVSFPSIYFNGYFPHLQTLNRLASVLNLVHDYFIVYAYAIGLKQQQVLSLIQKDDLYPKQLSIDLLNNSIQELRKREIENCIDLKLSDFIEDNYKDVKLFNQFNHPGREVFRFLADSVLTKINITDHTLGEQKPFYLDRIMTPVYRSTYKNLGLRFKENFNIYNGVKNSVYTQLTQEEVVSRYFDSYSKLNSMELKEAVIKHKPFIAEIIESNI